MSNIVKDVVIIGAGPGGLKSARILKKNNIDFVLLERGAPGGKVNIAPRVDNYPGQHEIYGPDLAFILFEQAMNEGVTISGENVLSVTKDKDLFIVETDQHTYNAKSVLVASGTEEKKIGLDRETEMFGKGLSYCALCDGHFFEGQDVIVVGGGNSALKEAIFLTDICKTVYVVHRRNEFRGSKKNLDELLSKDNVKILTPYTPKEILGENEFEGLIISHRETGEEMIVKANGFFPLIGQDPNTQFIKIENVLDDYRCIPVDKKYMSTGCDGLFAIGDCLPRVIKQIYLAEHDATVATENIIKYLQGK